MAALDDLARRLDSAVAAIVALRDRLDRTGPWPLAELYGTEAEALWGPHEVLAHVDEMLRFWLGEVERIVTAEPTTGPVPFGRIADDPLRIGIIGRDRRLPLGELLDRVAADGRRVAARMRELTATEAERTGEHQTRGPFTVSALLERFVVVHIEEHVSQLNETLAAGR
jgi:hypothetical protein